MTITRAEQVALSFLALLIAGVTLPYAADALGIVLMPSFAATAAILGGAAVALGWRVDVAQERTDVVVLVAIVSAAAGYLLWIAWPSLLPPGAGPDLTHHLVLIDYIERRGTLVHEADAHGLLGEMADYTPGVHLLSVLGGAVARSDGFAAVYAVVAASVALKAGIFFLTVRRLLDAHPQRVALATAGTGMLLHTSAYSVESFARDSFFAQVVAELFALSMFWALVAWWQQPARAAMVAFAAAGVATFLTWPVWVGPPMLACGLAVTMRREMRWSTRAIHLVLALAPVLAVAAFHTLGRTPAVGIVGTSGAVTLPLPKLFGWWVLAFAGVGLVVAARDRRYRMLLLFAAALALQTVTLWVVARRGGVDTPYMAIKMTYLAIYPAIAAVVIAASLIVRIRPLAWLVVLIVLATGIAAVWARPRPRPVVSHDLWSVGQWARQRLPPSCIDYLVGNADTAYWLHLAVLGNRRASARTQNNDTFDTQRTFERWLTRAGPPFAIANMPMLPADVLANTRVVYRHGDAAVLQRQSAAEPSEDHACAIATAASQQ